MDKLRSRTDPCSKLSRLGSRGQKVYGRMNYQVFYGFMGMEDDDKDAYKGDTISTSTRNQGGHPD